MSKIIQICSVTTLMTLFLFFIGCRSPVDTVISIAPKSLTCKSCGKNIDDEHLLSALGEYWHEDCLKCDCCGQSLINKGATLFERYGKKFCKEDYMRYDMNNWVEQTKHFVLFSE